jgi:hypothetical protein
MAKKAKKGGAAGQQSKKKHAKEVKRKGKPSTRPSRVQAPAPPAKPRFGWLPATEGIEGLAARVGIHYYEAACNAADHAGAAPNLLPSVVMIPSRVAALGTPALLARLAALGVVTDHDAFLATIGAEVSAVELANDVWIPHLAASTTVHDRDFVRLAACELWRRFRPEMPSTEGLLDLLHRGFDHARRDDDPRAVEIWLDFWTQLRKILPPEARTLKAVDGFFGKDFKSFDDWIEVLLSAAESAGESHPALARRTATLIQEVRALLSEETEQYQIMLLEDHAGLLFRTGRPEEGEQLLRDVIAREPANTDAYFSLAGLLAPDTSDDRGKIASALALLEEAATKGVKPGDRWGLDSRIAELRERLEEPDGDGDDAE